MQTPHRARGRPKSQFKESSAGTMKSLERALGLMTEIARMEHATLSELGRAVDLPTATAHRILTTLQGQGFASFDEDRQEWAIGLEAYRTGVAYLRKNGLVEVGRPVMRRLMQETGETANLAIRDGAEVVFIAQVESMNPVRALFPHGSRTPMHASGTGKAILAELSGAALARLLDDHTLERFTAQTLAEPEALRGDLRTIRARRWSLDREERYAGMSCVGAAIFNGQGEPWAGISVSGPTARFDDARVAELGKLVSEAAAQATELSGGVLPASLST